MRTPLPACSRPNPNPRRFARAAALLSLAASVALAAGGCGPSGVASLEAIREQQASGDFQGSLDPLRSYLAERPDDPEANFLYGRALSATGQANIAHWSLRKAFEHPDWRVPAGTQLALSALSMTDFNEVVEIAGRILEEHPDNKQMLLMRASAHAHWRKDPEQALADAGRVLELDPDMIEAYEPRILALLALGRFEEARADLATVGERLAERETDPQVLAWHCSTTAAFEEEGGELAQARQTWARCLADYPADLEVVSSAVRFFDSHGEPARSLEVLRAALEAQPDSRTLRIALAERLRYVGELAEAEALLQEATESPSPEAAANAWTDLARHRQALGEHAAAADAMEQAVEIAGELGAMNAEVELAYADALVLAGRLDRASEVAEGLSVPAQRALIRARVAQERRQPAAALEAFGEALRLWPDNPFARYHAALAAEELGDFERALAEYRYAVRISPGATDARTRGAALLFAGGSAQPALLMLSTAEQEAPLEMEGQLLALRIAGYLGDLETVRDTLARFEANQPAWSGQALAAAGEGVVQRAGPVAGFGVLAGAPMDYTQPHHAAALRLLVRLAHEAGKADTTREVVERALAAHPESSALHAIRGLDLELSGAAPESVRAAYDRALELAPGNAWALSGLGRLASKDDPEAAIALFDRAAAADPADPEPKREAARLAAAQGKVDDARRRLDRLLLVHPFDAEAAAARARLDLDAGVASAETLERAQRAVRVGGGPEALELLSRVYAARDETELAEQAAERARAIREAREAQAAKAKG